MPDLLIVGAGPVGCVVAERAAARGWSSLVVERRDHIAGNCYDRKHESGVLIHQYGPHYFRTNSPELRTYLSQFTDWIPGNYRVRSRVGGELLPFPINLDTLAAFFGVSGLTRWGAEALLARERVPIEDPQNSEEFVLSRVGRRLYEAFYLGYTLKQWDRHPRDLAPSVCGRIPVRLTRDDRYVDHGMQIMPADGFTRMFERMLTSPLIEVRLGTDYADVRETVEPRVATVYCGPLDAYFGCDLGRLPWRSLAFKFEEHDREFVQPCVQINYPDAAVPYTRTVEIKHATGQEHPRTVVSREYSRAEGDPYYPIPAPEYEALAERYRRRAEIERRRRRVYFAGRLARYLYINTDQAIEMALETFQGICRDQRSGL